MKAVYIEERAGLRRSYMAMSDVPDPQMADDRFSSVSAPHPSIGLI